MQIGKTIDDINIPIEGLCYADIAEIRQVFSERRHNLWVEFAGRSTRDFNELKTIQEEMYQAMSEMSPIGRCNRILRAIEKVEERLKDALGG